MSPAMPPVERAERRPLRVLDAALLTTAEQIDLERAGFVVQMGCNVCGRRIVEGLDAMRMLTVRIAHDECDVRLHPKES